MLRSRFEFDNEVSTRRKIIADGAAPKLTTSEMESRIFPFSDVAFSILAANPSEKSKTEAIMINNAAASIFL